MDRRPETRYARTPVGHVAFQVFGEGPIDVLFLTSWLSNVDAMWDDPRTAAYFSRLGRFARVLIFDKRGTGVSDPVPLDRLPLIEEWIDDALAALDEAGIDRVSVLADGEGGPMALVLAAANPDRVSSLALVNSFARWQRADDYPIGMPEETRQRLLDRWDQNWGFTPEILGLTAPSLAHDPVYRAWYNRYQRLCMPPGPAQTMYRWVTSLDVRSVLPHVRTPTLVVGRVKARHHRIEYSRYLAEHLPDARLVELPGADSYPFVAGDYGQILDEVEEFFTGHRGASRPARQLATVVLTDLVRSTDHLSQVGDAAWADLIRRHDSVVRELLGQFRGEELGHTGDGLLAVFDGPTRAVTFAARAAEQLAHLGLTMRAGVHTGEVERVDGAARGLAVHLVSRVIDHAPAGGIAVTRTVRDLVLGSGIGMSDLGRHELRGVPDIWDLFEVTSVP
ncbi:MAG TPA: alpha/beta fold hydrolase [Acidimicrobiia bacterium]|nr:alpha/beta fold hydrolase [Acidimicrobiia bacterium]